jgi:hypothetical protein
MPRSQLFDTRGNRLIDLIARESGRFALGMARALLQGTMSQQLDSFRHSKRLSMFVPAFYFTSGAPWKRTGKTAVRVAAFRLSRKITSVPITLASWPNRSARSRGVARHVGRAGTNRFWPTIDLSRS